MDVSGWTVDQRMRFPDWCFGNKKVISLYGFSTGVTTLTWDIHTLSLPDPVCIWEIMIMPLVNSHVYNYIRVGLTAKKPVNEAEMDASIPVLPDFGVVTYTPPRIYFSDDSKEILKFTLRKGMVTDGLYLTTEAFSNDVKISILIALVISELPTQMAGWLAHHKV